ncbi:MAG: phage tail protein [Acidocella sp.]|nr:phage tail protein [Acidocella sp.]
MPILQQGSINTTALVVPDLYVQIVPPQNLVLNGVPTNIIGVIGTATWGPVGQPAIIGTMADYAAAFGPIMPRKYDMATQVATAVQQGASNFRCVRVTDGTDTAAQLGVFYTGSNGPLVLTALYTGSMGNQIVVTFAPGSAVNSWSMSVSMPGLTPEVFDNLTGSGQIFYQNLVNAVNLGNGVLRGPSQIIVAAMGNSFSANPVAGSYAFSYGSAGSDGANNVNAATLVGNDTLPRRGMYALRSQGCSLGLLADADDQTQWTNQVAFGLSEGVYMIGTGPAGDVITNAVTAKQNAGIDSYAFKLLFGDWIWWSDTVNAQTRLVSPQGFVAGRLGNLSPEQSPLNKPLYGIIGSQKSGQPGTAQASTYASADLQTLFLAGIDVIANPQPGGSYWGVRCGHNSSSNAAINGDNYTRMTNYIAATLNSGMGLFVGQVINSTLFQQIRSTQLQFLSMMLLEGMLGSTDGSLPYSVVCDTTNNPISRTSLGYVQCDVQVQYQGINEKFIINIEGGQTVQVQYQTLPNGQAS